MDVSSERLLTPYFSNNLLMYPFTVLKLIPSSEEISLLDRPVTASSNTARSRGVSVSPGVLLGAAEVSDAAEAANEPEGGQRFQERDRMPGS